MRLIRLLLACTLALGTVSLAWLVPAGHARLRRQRLR